MLDQYDHMDGMIRDANSALCFPIHSNIRQRYFLSLVQKIFLKSNIPYFQLNDPIARACYRKAVVVVKSSVWVAIHVGAIRLFKDFFARLIAASAFHHLILGVAIS